MDKPRVRRLAERLKREGLRVWFDEWNIRAGEMIALKVDEGLDQSRVLLLCVSPHALASGWVALERSTAIHRDPANADRRFIPLLLAECELPDTLRRYKYVDFREDRETALAEVLAACRPEPAEAAPVVAPAPKKRSPQKGGAAAACPAEAEPLAVLERKLTGHEGWVQSVAVSPDGQWVASGSDDKTVKIWDLGTGECRATLNLHQDQVYSVAITADGKHVLSGSGDRSVRVWNTEDWRCINRLRLDGRALSVCPLPDNKSVLVGLTSQKDNVELWLFKRGQRIWGNRAQGYANSVGTYQIGRRGLSGHHGDFALRLWALDSGECLANLKGHTDTVCSVKITPDGRFAVSGANDKTIKIWDLDAAVCIGTLEGHTEKVHAVAVSPDGALIASTGFTDRTVRLWEVRSGRCLQDITDQWTGFAPISVEFSPDGSRLIVGIADDDGRIYVYRLNRFQVAPSAGAPRRYVNAKVVLLGEGTVGKTSLAHRLIEDSYVVRDRTHGMSVWRLELPLPPDAALEREALLWDLAGQEDYRLIHQLFLEQTALALMLVNPQAPDPFVDVAAWIKALRTASDPESKRDVSRLLVFSQVDVGGMKLGDAKIKRVCEQHGFADWLPTSAKTGENCSDGEDGGGTSRLKQLISSHIPWDKLPWTTTPRLLAELKNAVMAMRDASDIRLLRFSELAQRLEQSLLGEKFAEPDVRTAVTLLANHGLVRPLKFGDLVLLRPDLINGYAGAVIRAARKHADEIGCVPEADIYRLDFDFTGVERLAHRPDEELLLRALVQTFLDRSLCIAEETPDGRHLVFPSQYRREKDLPHEPDIFVSYTFGGEWQTIWTTLVVRLWYSHEFKHRELWRNAAEFESPKKKTLGLKITKAGDGFATISLYFDVELPDDLKVVFIEYVHRHLAKHACEVTRDRRYVCECGAPVKDLDMVRRRLDAKKAFITCQACDAKVPFADFIEDRLKSDPVARKILAMEEEATRQLDTQALEQILIGHMMAIAGEANQIFRPVTMFDHGIDGEVEFKDDDGKASGKRIYVQLKSGNSYLRTRQKDGTEIFDVKEDRHLEYWINQPVDVYLVIRQMDEATGQQVIRWMNVTRYLKARKDKQSRQIVFAGEKLDMAAVWRLRDAFFPPARVRK